MGLPLGMRMGEPALSNVEGPYVSVKEEDGTYHVRLSGTFQLRIDGTVTFYKRILVVFLGLLEVAGEARGSRRTRDGRTPLVRQQQIESWFGVPQSHISLWFK